MNKQFLGSYLLGLKGNLGDSQQLSREFLLSVIDYPFIPPGAVITGLIPSDGGNATHPLTW
jgi:hypothetical protein